MKVASFDQRVSGTVSEKRSLKKKRRKMIMIMKVSSEERLGNTDLQGRGTRHVSVTWAGNV
jgi:hypothetical protein